MNIQTPGLHHLALRVTELRASRHFYGTILGLPVILEGPKLGIGTRNARDSGCPG